MFCGGNCALPCRGASLGGGGLSMTWVDGGAGTRGWFSCEREMLASWDAWVWNGELEGRCEVGLESQLMGWRWDWCLFCLPGSFTMVLLRMERLNGFIATGYKIDYMSSCSDSSSIK